MEQNILFFFTGSGFLLLFGILASVKPVSRTLRTAFYVGLVGSGYSSIGFLAPAVNPIPCTVFIISAVVMIALVYVSQYRKELPKNLIPAERNKALSERSKILTRLSFGFAFVLALTAVFSFTNGQRESQQVGESIVRVVQRFAKELSTLNQTLERVEKVLLRVERLESQRAKADSSARAKHFKNQAATMRKLNVPQNAVNN